ncbi:MAG: DUF502 domain-containing protein [Betaproteobacteria bacterium]|jgi:uncharacterized membrane protein
MKKYFIAGILVWSPVAITIWVITWVLGILDGVFGSVMKAIITIMPSSFSSNLQVFRDLPGVGIGIVIIVIVLTGLFAITIAGRWILKVWGQVLNRIPIVRSIYSSVKQVSDTLLSSSGQAFRQVVLIRYPHENSWVIAFQTGNPVGEVAEKLGTPHIHVFLPTTPNPTSGFFMIVPKDSVIELSMSVEDALKHIVSMGSVPPNASAEISSSPNSN